jgi:outer membrane protein OmpA-like peptidoglycan-associated protein
MSFRAFTAVLGALVCAAPAVAQVRGTVEFGAFGSAASFDNALSLKSGYGGGGRVGMYLDPRWSIEFEDAEMRATRPNGLRDVNVGILSGRLVAVPMKAGSLSLLLGAGAGVSTETNFLHSYGVDVLAGVKKSVRSNMDLRADVVFDWLANENWKTYRSVRVGLSMYRHPARSEVRTVTVNVPSPAPPPMMTTPADSVSAAETRRLRGRDAALQALRDSLRNNPPRPMPAPMSATPPVTRVTVESMEAHILFAFNKSELTDSAKTILDNKVRIFRDNPTMLIVLSGFTDTFGSDAYNMALGTRRAEAAQAYIVGKGIASNRIIIESRGERQPATQATTQDGQAPNRRVIFRLLMAPDVSGR